MLPTNCLERYLDDRLWINGNGEGFESEVRAMVPEAKKLIHLCFGGETFASFFSFIALLLNNNIALVVLCKIHCLDSSVLVPCYSYNFVSAVVLLYAKKNKISLIPSSGRFPSITVTHTHTHSRI